MALVDLVLERLRGEPSVVVGVVVAGLILAAGKLHIILDKATLTEVVTPVVTGLLVRPQVVPKRKHEEVVAALPKG